MKTIPLSDLPCGCVGIVAGMPQDSNTASGIMRLGLVRGTAVEAVIKAPGGNTAAYYFRNTLIALRNDVTSSIQVCSTEPEGDSIDKCL